VGGVAVLAVIVVIIIIVIAVVVTNLVKRKGKVYNIECIFVVASVRLTKFITICKS